MLDGYNLSLERPLISGRDEPGSDRIFENVVPFLRITLAVPIEMIEESALPKSTPAARDGGSYNTLQPAHPNTQIKVIGTGYKHMNVVRHDHITAECASTRGPLRPYSIKTE
ncbi:MAG: hypothetical protein QOF93_55 [Verrucomicrobiota bacterium]